LPDPDSNALVFVGAIGAADGFGRSNLTRLALTHAATGGAGPAGVADVR
jgi:hypothetical protein